MRQCCDTERCRSATLHLSATSAYPVTACPYASRFPALSYRLFSPASLVLTPVPALRPVHSNLTTHILWHDS